MRSVIFYTVYALAAVALFIYYLFPGEAVKAYVVRQFGERQPGYTLSIDTVEPAFPPGLTFGKLAVDRDELRFGAVDRLRLSPNPVSIFGSNPKVAFNGDVGDGTVNGVLTLVKRDGNTAPTALEAKIQSVRLENTEFFSALAPITVKGLLNGTIEYTETADGATGAANLVISAGGVASAEPLFRPLPLRDLTFNEIHGKFSLEEGRSLKVETFEAKGSEANGTVSGTILLRQPLNRSVLNLNGTLKPHPSLIAKLGNMVTMLFGNKAGQAIPFTLGGTMENPKFSMK